MRCAYFFYLLLAIGLLACYQPDTLPSEELSPFYSVGTDDDIAAIREVIIAQNDAFTRRDAEEVVSYHTSPNSVIQNIAGTNEIMNERFSHEEMLPLLQQYFDTFDATHLYGDKQFERIKWHVEISQSADMAWATYHEQVRNDVNVSYTDEIRVLHKVDGEWKLALVGTFFPQ